MSSMSRTTLTTNPVTDKLRSGQPSVGSWLTLCSPAAAETMAHVGWDWLVVDVEHSPVGFETMVNCFRAAQLGGAVPMARVPWNDTIWIQRTLDAGAFGLVVPMVNSADDAAQVVANMKYATRGQRSSGGVRLAPYIDGDYRRWADEHLAVIVMIETIQAVNNAEAILAVDGVVGCFIGPNDLALSMGLTLSDTGPGTAHEDAMLEVLRAAQKVGKAAGKHCFSAAEVTMRIAQGFQFLALASDGVFMSAAAKQALSAIDLSGRSADASQTGTGQLY
ncbi:MAG TPA: aldolase/citrate lyase family protein [Roseiflexaceae bacterium]|nr:aldolase/citrate lyase family protein [Roseiflexaceae bacterium]HMP39481.1 aldolase/citrate lyase family protein [Roseiflexaceae bacterium]